MPSQVSLTSEFEKSYKAMAVVLISVVTSWLCDLGYGLAKMVNAIILMELLFAAHEDLKRMLSPRGYLDS